MLILPPQNARKFIELLGKGGKDGIDAKVQFEDMNAHGMKRPYKKYIQRIDEMERILRFITEEITNSNPELPIEKNRIEEFIKNECYDLDVVEKELQELNHQFAKFQENNGQLKGELVQAQEEIEVMNVAIRWLKTSGTSTTDVSASAPLLTAERRLNNVSGVVADVDKERFRRALWRASRGNTFVEFSQIREEKDGQQQPIEKSVFVVYFQNSPDSSTQSAMMSKVMKVCGAFGVRQYNWPRDSTEALDRKSLLDHVREDKETTLNAFQQFMTAECKALVEPVQYLTEITGNSVIEDLRLFCLQEKSIYATLNCCHDDMTLRVDCWYPEIEEDNIKRILDQGNLATSKEGGMQAALVKYDNATSGKHPPTYIQINDFTEPWQDVINTYGIPNYGTANPAAITTVTFPFIFGMMYGDIGHGCLLTCIGAALCMFSGNLKYGAYAQLFKARFLVLQLGLFATFAGFMYNDFFGMTSLQLFTSRFQDSDGNGAFTPIEGFDTENTGNGFGPYPFGVDWAWHGSANELLYINSLKMKLSVLMGVIQMTLGLFLRVGNAVHDRSLTDLICECIPMFVFMICFFGFMDFMILYKWTHVISGEGTDGPPSIINSLICMAMFQEDKQPLWNGSGDFAHNLMACAVCAVPIMLLPKPFILLKMHNDKKARGDNDEESAGGGHGHGDGEFQFGEIFIHQIIETIEFVLGTVSHTASYLRIWALSLAHQQLSLVFYQKTLMMVFTSNLGPVVGGIATFCAFAAWFGVTSGVLLGMDVLECFLHTLRLHWVEFQSKFYKSDSGVLFAPYSIKALVEESDA